jgi:hypothetical protein
MRRFAALIGGALLVMTTGGSALGAAPVDRFHDRYDFIEEDVKLCDLVLTIHFQGSLSGVVKVDETGAWLATIAQLGHYTLTNEANGKVLINHFAGSSMDESVVDNGDGTITVTYAIQGAGIFRDPSGRPIVQGTGRIIYADTIDLNGTPDDNGDDFLSSYEIPFIAGPHDYPDGGSLCAAVRLGLS